MTKRRRCNPHAPMRAPAALAASALVVASIAVAIIGMPRAAKAGATVLPGECPEVMAVAEVAAGTKARGWTVSRGGTPEPFVVEVLGVLRDGIAPGRDMIIVEIDDVAGSAMIARAGGIWSGMSGSPVYVGDRLLGAVAWTFSVGPSRVGGVTAAKDMLDVLSFAAEPDERGLPLRIPVPPSLRASLAARAGLEPAQVTAFEPLRVPFAASGLGAHRLRLLESGLRRVGISSVVMPASSGDRPRGAAPRRPAPGENFAALFSFGDVSIGGVGTTTYVCEDRALAFGHPLARLGPVTLGANDADAITIVTDPTTGPFKLANFGPSFGLLDQDRGVAIRAALDQRPALIPISSRVRGKNSDRERRGKSWTPASQFVPDIGALHLLSNLDVIFDQTGGGTVRMWWKAKGQRADGRDWSFVRRERYASDRDAVGFPFFDLLGHLATIERNPVEPVTFTAVRMRAVIDHEFDELAVAAVRISKNGGPFLEPGQERARAGDDIVVRVWLRRTGRSLLAHDFPITLPADAGGSVSLAVFGGSANGILVPGVGVAVDDPDECLFDHAACEGEPTDSFEDYLDEIAQLPKNNDLVVDLTVSRSVDESLELRTVRRMARSVSGTERYFFSVDPTTTTTVRAAATTVSTSSSTSSTVVTR